MAIKMYNFTGKDLVGLVGSTTFPIPSQPGEHIENIGGLFIQISIVKHSRGTDYRIGTFSYINAENYFELFVKGPPAYLRDYEQSAGTSEDVVFVYVFIAKDNMPHYLGYVPRHMWEQD